MIPDLPISSTAHFRSRLFIRQRSRGSRDDEEPRQASNISGTNSGVYALSVVLVEYSSTSLYDGPRVKCRPWKVAWNLENKT